MRYFTLFFFIFFLTGLIGCGGDANDENLEEATTVVTERMNYTVADKTFEGYMAWDTAIQEKRPGILIVHEWWGQNDYTERRARMLAELGYTAFSLDMFGAEKETTHPNEAMEFVQEVYSKTDAARSRFTKALEILQSHPTVHADDIGAIGYCFGGGIVLQMAREGLPLDGVASFHGSLGTETPAQKEQLQGKVFVAHGAEDSFTSEDGVRVFKNEMDLGSIDYEFVTYPNAKHGFTNPAADSLGAKRGIDVAYNEEADKQSWEDMKAFFKEVFGEEE